jgi:hypothetical protein
VRGQRSGPASAWERCDACGANNEIGEARVAPAADGPPRRPSRVYVAADFDLAGLEGAFEAFRAREFVRAVELVLASEGAKTGSAPSADGPGWITTTRGAVVFLSVRGDDLSLEAPIARLPQQRRLPALRVALELCANEEASSRACLRGELLLLRFTGRVAMLAPHLVRFHLREIASLAARYAGLMAVACETLPPFADDEQRGFEALGRPRKIQIGGRRSVPPPPMPPPPAPPPPASPTNGGPQPAAAVGNADTIPPVLAPMVRAAAQEAPPREAAAPAPESDVPAILDPQRRPTQPEQAAVRTPRTEVELPGFARRASMASMSSAALEAAVAKAEVDPALAPPDRLCLLLHQARSLASILSEQRPASTGWVVRSTVYRAFYEFKETLPDAVAILFRASGAARDGRAGEPSGHEPALAAMDRVMGARGLVGREQPVAVEPMTSATQAKEHVARFLAEIERVPGDAALRHFLALGALTELLVRTRLPPQTEQRLRDIVGHAQREGPKAGAIDLMMTALNRITA